MDYLKETGLKESAKLHKSISGNLAKLADLITWRNYQIDNAKYSECISKGVIPIDAGHVTFGADNGIYEMPKQVFDTIIKSTTNMMMIIFCAMIRHEKISYDELCQWVIKDLVT